MAWVVAELVSALALHYHAPLFTPAELFSIAPASVPPSAANGRRQGLFPCSHAHRYSHLQSHLHCVAQSRHGTHSPKCCSLKGATTALLLSHTWSWLTCAYPIRASSTLLPRHDVGSSLPSPTASKGAELALLLSYPL